MFSVFYHMLNMLTKIYGRMKIDTSVIQDSIDLGVGQVVTELKAIEDLLQKILDGQSRYPARVIFSFNGKRMDTMAQMKDSDVAVISVLEIDDAKGFKIEGAALDAGALFSLDDASMGSLEVSEDGQSCKFSPAKPGLVHVMLSASIGGVAIVGQSEDIVVTPGDAAIIKLGVALA